MTCGIAGWVDWDRDLRFHGQLVEAMGSAVGHRGPNDRGTWLSSRCGFAHRRLTVVDPEGGAQPMVRYRGDSAYVITYNGELYNTPEIQRQLLSRGHVLRGYSDTEALLLSYIEWGPDCVERFNGIFAFGIWSEADQSLFLARDRLGVKPLFYYQRGNTFLFGSEIKAILAHPDVEPRLDPDGLAEVFIIGPARTPGHGIFKGVNELRPGCGLLHSRDGTRISRYWQLSSHPHEQDVDTTVDTVRHLLADAVGRQLVSDVPLCTLLSGGLDSSAITAIASHHLARRHCEPMHTYSVDYAGNDRYFRATSFQPDADGPWIERMTGYLGTCHHRVEVDTEELALALYNSMRANDLPGMADVDSSLYLFCREIRRDHTVALSGEGADEIFGGYPWFRDLNSIASDTFPWARAIDKRAALLTPEVRDWIKPEEYLAMRYREALEEVPRLPGEEGMEARMREVFYLNITRFMQTLLDRKDRMSMAVGLEVRVPYCDHRLVEYVWNVPLDIKFLDQREKGLLRRALKGVLPDAVLRRRKSPYPKTHNPVYEEVVAARLHAVLEDSLSPLVQLIDVARIRTILERREDLGTWFGQLMARPQLFAYLTQTDMWLREYRALF